MRSRLLGKCAWRSTGQVPNICCSQHSTLKPSCPLSLSPNDYLYRALFQTNNLPGLIPPFPCHAKVCRWISTQDDSNVKSYVYLKINQVELLNNSRRKIFIWFWHGLHGRLTGFLLTWMSWSILALFRLRLPFAHIYWWVLNFKFCILGRGSIIATPAYLPCWTIWNNKRLVY